MLDVGEVTLFPGREDEVPTRPQRKCHNCGHYEGIDLHECLDAPRFRCLVRDEIFGSDEEDKAATCKAWMYWELALW
ncbi:MAG: hypothetical protein M1358_03645 [Chloroflexi bacterium]|nr:hypothetical protein [Chloroflexota bacterium]